MLLNGAYGFCGVQGMSAPALGAIVAIAVVTQPAAMAAAITRVLVFDHCLILVCPLARQIGILRIVRQGLQVSSALRFHHGIHHELHILPGTF